ncbi:MAG: hypothetical protein KatS3mg131_2726 [Candidatus Tectimicrobiota bacterium]|nr:MAG: hypothetical protein KatS3mg131_2726 [Candidatus Tectomicrobia bacterium]
METATERERQLMEELAALRRRVQELEAAVAAHAHAQEALQEYKALYEILFEHSNDPMLMLSLDGIFLRVNRAMADMLGWPREALIGRHYGLVATEASLRQWDERTRRALAGERLPRIFESEIRRRNGQVVPIECRTGFVRDASGRPVGIHGTYRDIRARRRLEAQLRQAQKLQAIGTLAGGIAHDFNNILAAILGYTELALYDLPSASPARRSMEEVLAAGKRARDLIRQILTFSRQGSQKREPVSLATLVQEVLTLLRASLPATVAIRQHLAPDAGTVLADPTQLHQVLLNLCTNAEHAMRPGGGVLEVEVDAVALPASPPPELAELPPGSYVRLRVRDTGHGMPPEVKERLFEPFFTTKGPGEGTGMGLAVVHGIVTSHGGAITVESAPGAGTTFTVYLPRHAAPPAVATPPEVSPAGQGCVLLVDDEAAIVDIAQRLLAQLGYTVEAYTSGAEALAAFRAAPQRFDLVITDQTMPEMTGVALIEALRRLRPDVPVILCTGFSHIVDATQAQQLGISAFLYKPLTGQELGQVVQQVLQRRAGGV